MTDSTAILIWLCAAGYGLIGLLVGVVSTLFLMGRLNPGGGALPWRVRALVLPGLVALWPLILLRLAGAKPEEDRP